MSSNETLIWVDTAGGIADVAQAAAIVAGGAWAYFKFIRGRTFARRAGIGLTARMLVDPTGRYAIEVTATLQNTGAAKIELGDTKLALVYRAADAAGATTGTGDAALDWETPPFGRRELFGTHGWIESGELVTDEALIPVAAGRDELGPAYRVVVMVDSPAAWMGVRKAVSWTAQTVVAAGFTEVERSSAESGAAAARGGGR